MRTIVVDATDLLKKLDVKPGDLFVLQIPIGFAPDEFTNLEPIGKSFADAGASLIALPHGVTVKAMRDETMGWLKSSGCMLYGDGEWFVIRHPKYGSIARGITVEETISTARMRLTMVPV